MIAPSNAALIDGLTSLVSQAAAAILAVRRGPLDVRIKSDQSPVTAADKASEAVLIEGVARLLPGIPVISEESVDQADAQDIGDAFILIDPLDGTREFVAGRDEFTINLALVRAHSPALGIVAAPALGLFWRTTADGGAERLRVEPGAPVTSAKERAAIRTRPMPDRGAIAVVSRSHLDPATKAFLTRLPAVSCVPSGSAIKLCRVAEGAADIYPRLAPTQLWDVAAGHAVLAAAGGTVTKPQGLPLSYRPATEGLLIPGFVAWGDGQAVAATLNAQAPSGR